jgi:hypothetical protein
MSVTFEKIKVGSTYSRNDLAILWGYKSFHAIARGIVTPQGDNKIVVFITEEKQASARQYVDNLRGNVLETEGPDDHFAEERIANAATTGEEVHLFHRDRHHTDFTYKGRMKLIKLQPRTGIPSHFKYQVL